MLISKQIDESEIYQNKIKKLQVGQRYFVLVQRANELSDKLTWIEARFKYISGFNQKVLVFEYEYEASNHISHKMLLTVNTLDYLINESQILTAKEFYERKAQINKDLENVFYEMKKEKTL